MNIVKEKYKNLKYIISYPDGYEKDKKYPIMFYTHGAGSRGNDLSLLNIDVPILNNPAKEDFIIVALQCFADTWFEIFEQLLEFCEFVYQSEFADKTRFYSIGASMGGYTAYQLMMSRPRWFAAGIICCGGGMYWNAGRLKSIPLRIFHGLNDDVVFPTESMNLVKRINQEGGNAELTIFEDCDHNCWDKVFTNKENFDWFLRNKKQ